MLDTWMGDYSPRVILKRLVYGWIQIVTAAYSLNDNHLRPTFGRKLGELETGVMSHGL